MVHSLNDVHLLQISDETHQKAEGHSGNPSEVHQRTVGEDLDAAVQSQTHLVEVHHSSHMLQ